MADYDAAIEFDPDNFLAHYNRGLLRIQVGDDNRAIDDFNYIIKNEPDNLMTIYNRAMLYQRTGQLRMAISDYSKIIRQYPNFWNGLYNRSECYRKLGMHRQADADVARIVKAQMDKHVGIQPRWSKAMLAETRKKSEIDFSKYNRIVMPDEQQINHEYESSYRGKVQNRIVMDDPMPMFHVSLLPYTNSVASEAIFNEDVETINAMNIATRKLNVTCNPQALTASESKQTLDYIDSLAFAINNSFQQDETFAMLFSRAVSNTVAQDLNNAIIDLTTCLNIDSLSMLVYWQRAVCFFMQSQIDMSQGDNSRFKINQALYDIEQAIKLTPANALLYYNKANILFQQRSYTEAISEYGRALSLNSNLAEAYYNRGMAHMRITHRNEAIADLSKAGELGLYSAYSVMKRIGM